MVDNSFKKQAIEIIEIEIDKLNSFYDQSSSDEEEDMKKRIMDVHFEFFAGANFKYRDDPRNRQLSERLLKELNELRKLLE
ncbi:hypothetical protein [Paenibacillus silvisoli]|uniref:hypothetical protein n=1 Tax=Paenibacillus silvisoli TaxID=3110539 RepID=UPI0028039358|nr:hypothetical protein [Paenibacillus silvisoli]